MKSHTVKDTIFPIKKAKERLSGLIDHFPSAKVLVVGDFILDEFVWGSVERISPEAPVPVVNVQRESFMPGGALNVANNIRTLGAKVYPCGVVGRDLRGRMLVKAMRREGIDIGGVVFDETRPTTLKTRVIAHSQQVVRFDREDARAMTQMDLKRILDFIHKKLPEVDVVIVEDYGKGVVGPELLTKVLRQAKSLKKPVLVDPKEKNFPYYRGVTAITPNRKEAYAAYGKRANGKAPDLYEVGKGLIKRFACDAVLITLGEEGMMLFESSGEISKIPTAAKEVYDVSGAGDTVIATFALALAGKASMKEAAVISNLAAGIVVGKLGTATTDLKELRESLVEQTKGMKKDMCCHV